MTPAMLLASAKTSGVRRDGVSAGSRKMRLVETSALDENMRINNVLGYTDFRYFPFIRDAEAMKLTKENKSSPSNDDVMKLLPEKLADLVSIGQSNSIQPEAQEYARSKNMLHALVSALALVRDRFSVAGKINVSLEHHYEKEDLPYLMIDVPVNGDPKTVAEARWNVGVEIAELMGPMSDQLNIMCEII